MRDDFWHGRNPATSHSLPRVCDVLAARQATPSRRRTQQQHAMRKQPSGHGHHRAGTARQHGAVRGHLAKSSCKALKPRLLRASGERLAGACHGGVQRGTCRHGRVASGSTRPRGSTSARPGRVDAPAALVRVTCARRTRVLCHPHARPTCGRDALAARCGGNTHATVHDLDATRGQSATLHLSLSLWAELCRYRAAEARTSAAPPSPPAGVGKAQWTAVLSGAHRLYLSAFEAQVHAPELAASFNSLVEPVCTLRHVPGAHDNLGPIIMHADAGASSGWCAVGSQHRMSHTQGR